MSKIIDEDGNELLKIICIGCNGDYFNLDVLVMDVINNMIVDWYQEDFYLVVIIGC